MTLLEKLAETLDVEAGELAEKIGVEADAEDAEVMAAYNKHVQATVEPVAEPAPEPVVAPEPAVEPAAITAEPEPEITPIIPEAVAAQIGVDPGADETTILAAVMTLKGTVATAAAAADTLTAKEKAEALVGAACEAGKIPPAVKEWWMTQALQNVEAAKMAIDNLPVITNAPTPAGAARKVTTEQQAAFNRAHGLPLDTPLPNAEGDEH